MKNIITFSALIAVLFLSSNCAVTVPAAPIEMSSVHTGIIASDGVEITAMDDSFTLKANERFTPPFQSSKYFYDTSYAPLVQDVYKLTAGEFPGYEYKKVRVKTPYNDTDLYGVISFSKVLTKCANQPTTRSYRVQVPSGYVKKALNGKVSCVYEYYSCNGKDKIATWVLWLSDVPF